MGSVGGSRVATASFFLKPPELGCWVEQFYRRLIEIAATTGAGARSIATTLRILQSKEQGLLLPV